jgi:coenzyme F420-reducing hydrogenase gamma subunit
MPVKPALAVWKFSSCDGCQLTLLNCESELLTIADAVTIANFPEASREMLPGPYDISLVEGSIATPEDEQRIKRVRQVSRYLITIGACATAGGVQALRNAAQHDLSPLVYPNPGYLDTLRTSTPIASHVQVDYELRGCPVDKGQLLEVIAAFTTGRRPAIRHHSVCLDCKRAGRTCVLVARGVPCLGPYTQAGCGALCPAAGRGCFGCFGPAPGWEFLPFAPQAPARAQAGEQARVQAGAQAQEGKAS